MIELTDLSEGAITSPGFSSDLLVPNNLNCTYEFVAMVGYKVEAILEVDTQNGLDYLQVSFSFTITLKLYNLYPCRG